MSQANKTERELKLEKEMQRLMAFVEYTRGEVAAMAAAQDSAGVGKNIYGIGDELKEISDHTESATNTIMDHAEEVLRLSTKAIDRHLCTSLSNAATGIMEACSFQDVTGQRTNKAMSAINEVQARVERMVELLGVDRNVPVAPLTDSTRSDSELLAGPQLEGEGVKQSEVDAMLNDKN